MKIIITIEDDGRDEVEVFTRTKSEETNMGDIIKRLSQYACVFDNGCIGWTVDPTYNMSYLKSQERYANDVLRIRGYLLLNDVYDLLGMPRTKAGCVVGWIYDEKNPIGDNYVDFGLSNTDINSHFINREGNVAYLDFNVDGVIIDYIK